MLKINPDYVQAQYTELLREYVLNVGLISCLILSLMYGTRVIPNHLHMTIYTILLLLMGGLLLALMSLVYRIIKSHRSNTFPQVEVKGEHLIIYLPLTILSGFKRPVPLQHLSHISIYRGELLLIHIETPKMARITYVIPIQASHTECETFLRAIPQGTSTYISLPSEE